jgi:hypothetical protein
MPGTTWAVSRSPPGSSRAICAQPGFDANKIISTRHQRFASARLLDPHLTGYRPPYPQRSPPRPLSRRSLRWFAASPCRATAEGPILHRRHSTTYSTFAPTCEPLSMFVAHRRWILRAPSPWPVVSSAGRTAEHLTSRLGWVQECSGGWARGLAIAGDAHRTSTAGSVSSRPREVLCLRRTADRPEHQGG